MSYITTGELKKILELYPEDEEVTFTIIGQGDANVETIQCTLFPSDDLADQYLRITLTVDDDDTSGRERIT